METETKEIVVKQVELEPVQRKAIIEYVEEKMRNRKEKVGKVKVDDFLCGAMSVMFSFGMEPPPSWVFGILCNRPELYGMGKK